MRHEAAGNGVGPLRLDRLLATRAVRPAHRREQHTEVVVDLRHCAHRGARVAYRRPLFDGDGRRQTRDRLDLGLVHLLQELSCVRREALDVASLALRVQRVEGETALPGAGRTRDDDQAVARQVAVDALEVVNPGSADGNGLR